MVKIFFRGKEVGTLDENPDELRTLLDGGATLDVVNDAGRVLASLRPEAEPLVPWEPTVSKAELDRRAAEPGGMPLDEFWKQMGVR